MAVGAQATPLAQVSFTKDPNDVLDYSFDWSQWLQSGETINGLTVIASPGIVVNTTSYTNTSSTAWLSGGVAGAAGTPYTVEHRITTNQGRTKNLTMYIRVLNK